MSKSVKGVKQTVDIFSLVKDFGSSSRVIKTLWLIFKEQKSFRYTF